MQDEPDLDPEQALEQALDWLEAEPDCADAHYEAALAYEDLGLERERRQHLLEVWRLDARDERRLSLECERLIAGEVERTLGELPPGFAERLGPVTILVEPRPGRDLVEAGWDPRLLGFFEGATSQELSGTDAPLTTTRILIFSHNLAASFEDDDELRREVRVTVLHEVGHFFGLDEDDMHRLGLE